MAPNKSVTSVEDNSAILAGYGAVGKIGIERGPFGTQRMFAYL